MVRPIGVLLLSLFLIIQGILNIGIIISSILTQGYFQGALTYHSAISVISIVVAVGMIRGSKWGRWGTIALSILKLIIGILGVIIAIDFAEVSHLQTITTVFVNFIVVFYLTRPEVVAYFEGNQLDGSL